MKLSIVNAFLAVLCLGCFLSTGVTGAALPAKTNAEPLTNVNNPQEMIQLDSASDKATPSPNQFVMHFGK
uniref:Putative secreted protein n=1 Tax=Psorophora albipes TaxID=869069 RepID=T1DJE4_9DIPT